MTADRRDMRDPQGLGERILARRQGNLSRGLPLSECVDDYRELAAAPLVAEADGRIVSPLERYGDPRRHPAPWGQS